MRRVSCLLALVLVLVKPASLTGQAPLRAPLSESVSERPSFDYYLSRYRARQGRVDEGVGGRLMWSLAPLARDYSPWLTRAYLGGYFVRSPDDAERSRSWRYGAQADFLLLDRPLTGRISPFVSLGVGATREQVAHFAPALARRADTPATTTWVRTTPSVAPGLGIRLQISPGLGLRGDAREVVDFGAEVRRKLELSGGLSIGV